MSKLKSLEELREIVKALDRPKIPKLRVIDDNFPKQKAFIEDPSKLKAVRCTRRAGKSYGLGLYLFQTALDYPGSSLLYSALTRDSVERIMFKDVFRHIDRKFFLKCRFTERPLKVIFQNGSIIYCLGLDKDEKEMEKILGQKFRLAVFDEADSFRQDLRKIVYEKTEPATIDLNGPIVLAGSPGDVAKGLFYDITWKKCEPRAWSVHTWTAYDNPYIKDQWDKQIKEMIAQNPRIVETPYFRRHMMGEYVEDMSRAVYKFSRDINSSESVPEDLIYVLGVDLGYNDDSAFVVMGFHKRYGRKLYIVDVFSKKGMDITAVAEKIRFFEERYKPYQVVIDGSNKQAVEEMRIRHDLCLLAADKTGKSDFIELMNSDFLKGDIKLLLPHTEQLAEEYGSLIWDDKERADKKRVEHPSCDNHRADAALYAWRFCLQYFNELVKPPDLTEIQRIDLWEENEAKSLENNKNLPFWERL